MSQSIDVDGLPNSQALILSREQFKKIIAMNAVNKRSILASSDEDSISSSSNRAELELKISELVKHSQLGPDEHHYIEIVNDEHGRVSTRLLDASAVTGNTETTIVQADQVVGLDLMNFRVISCDDDVITQEITEDDGEVDVGSVVMQVEDGQQTQYVVHHSSELSEDENAIITVPSELQPSNSQGTQYMHVVEQDSVPLVFFTDKPNTLQQPKQEPSEKPTMRRKGKFVITEKLMKSPNFKFYLYSCKQCDFKCNAIKELTAHRLKHHSTNGIMGRFRQVVRPNSSANQSSLVLPQTAFAESSPADVIYGLNMSFCSACSYSSISSQQIKRHILKAHNPSKNIQNEDLEGNVKESKIHRYSKSYDRGNDESQLSMHHFFCEDCGYETGSKHLFKRHNCNRSANQASATR